MIRIFIFSLLIGGPFSDFVPHAIAQTSASPVAHWKFDEGIGTVASDAAGNSDGSIIGAIWIQGAVGTALDFKAVATMYASMIRWPSTSAPGPAQPETGLLLA